MADSVKEQLAKRTLALDPSGIDDACALLTHADAEVRALAAHYLGYVAEPAALTFLGRVAGADPDPMVRKAAGQAVERVVGDRAREPVVPWEPPKEALAADAVRARVMETVNAETVAPPPLSTGVEDPVRARVMAAVLAEPEPEIRPLPKPPPRAVVAPAPPPPPPKPEDPITAARRRLGDGDPETRKAALAELVPLADADLLGRVAALLRDGDSGVRVAAIDALVVLAERFDQKTPVRTWLTSARYMADPATREAAESAIARLFPPG